MTTTADSRTAFERLLAALADPDASFTGEQVAWFMAEAARWGREAVEDESPSLVWNAGHTAGYWARVAEENAAYPPPPVFVLGRWFDQVDYRRRCDHDARRRRRGDYRGGPLRPWPPSWCGTEAAHGRHPAEDDRGVRFMCEGRHGG